ncbi:MAG: hypothetical protein VZQ82_06875 [Lachnospiraceae bacterium]|nr:hypothetical protein [Lachnospiraceae bacterium]
MARGKIGRMQEAAERGAVVRVRCTDGMVYTGKAALFMEEDEDEAGAASFCVEDPEGPVCLLDNEIEFFDIVG